MIRNDSLDDLESDLINLEEEVGAEIQPDEWWVNKAAAVVDFYYL